ncbi:hypothetical protein [Escherichia coli]|nr:hypothetical protein [Escherichia coli]
MLGGADNPNGELPSYITGANIPSLYKTIRQQLDWRTMFDWQQQGHTI